MSHNVSIISVNKGDIILSRRNDIMPIPIKKLELEVVSEYTPLSPYGTISLGFRTWNFTIEPYDFIDESILRHIKKNIKEYSIELWAKGKNHVPELIEKYKDLHIEHCPRNDIIWLYARECLN